MFGTVQMPEYRYRYHMLRTFLREPFQGCSKYMSTYGYRKESFFFGQYVNVYLGTFGKFSTNHLNLNNNFNSFLYLKAIITALELLRSSPLFL